MKRSIIQEEEDGDLCITHTEGDNCVWWGVSGFLMYLKDRIDGTDWQYGLLDVRGRERYGITSRLLDWETGRMELLFTEVGRTREKYGLLGRVFEWLIFKLVKFALSTRPLGGDVDICVV